MLRYTVYKLQVIFDEGKNADTLDRFRFNKWSILSGCVQQGDIQVLRDAFLPDI